MEERALDGIGGFGAVTRETAGREEVERVVWRSFPLGFRVTKDLLVL